MAHSTEIEKAADAIIKSKRTVAFTGAGVSVESGIPPFRGENGIWNKYDPTVLDISYFHSNPDESWKIIKDLFYDFFGSAKPNKAHEVLAWMQRKDLLHAVITQNIDNLHHEAGNTEIYEFHGNSRVLVCISCQERVDALEEVLAVLPPRCEKCGGLLKPDFIFFGEAIPEPARSLSFAEIDEADCFIVIGTTGEVMPASMIPRLAKQKGATIIEVNVSPSHYTAGVTDIFLEGRASEMMDQLQEALGARLS
jgi:NAD-dependent deacetylase